MKKRVPTLVAVAVLAGLGSWVAFNETKPKEDPDKVHCWRVTPENIVSFELRDVERSLAVSCARDHGAWRITAPVALDADTEMADLVAKHLADPELERKLDLQQDLTPYGLKPARWRCAFKMKDGKGHVLLLGIRNPTDTGSFAMEEGGAAIYTVVTWSADNLRKSLADLRSKQLLALDPARVTRLVIRRRKVPTIELTRQGEAWRMTQPLAAPADKYAIDALLADLKSLKGLDVLDEPGAYSRYKLDQPAVEAVVYTGTGSGQTITLARPNPLKDEAYGSSSRLPFVFRLANATAIGSLAKAPEDFRERLLLSANKEDLSNVEITAGSLSISCQRGKNGAWTIVKPAGVVADQALNDMLFEIIYVRVEKFAGDRPGSLVPYGLQPAHADIRLTGTKDKVPFTAHYRIGARSGDHAFLAFADQPSVYEVRRDLLDKVERFADAVRSAGKPVAPATAAHVASPATPAPPPAPKR
jgi:hypothetical protein